MEDNGNSVDLFELKPCCEISSRLHQNEEISTVGGSSSQIFVGTTQGRIFHVKKHQKGFKVAGNLELQLKREIRQIEFASALDIMLVLCDNILFDIGIGSFEVQLNFYDYVKSFDLSGFVKILSNRTSVQCVSVNSNPIVDDAFCLQTAVATTGKQVHICERRNGKTDTIHKLSTDGVVTALAFSRLTICFASNGMYNIYHVDKKLVVPLFPFDSQVVRPYICNVETDFLMNGMDGLLISVTEQGVSVRPPTVVPSTSVIALAYNSPYVYIRSLGDVWIVSLEDARITQSLKVEDGKVLCSLDGAIFAASYDNLFTVSMTSLEKQVDILMSQHKYDEALALYERRLNQQFDEEKLLNFIELKKDIAFKYLEENSFEKAAELLISAEIEPNEVISRFPWPPVKDSDENQDCYQFLEEYLMQIRDLRFTASSRSFIDSCLLKLYVVKGDPETVLALKDYSPDYTESAQFLEDSGFHHYAAEMWILAGEETKAWEIWRQLSSGEIKDDHFKLEQVLDRMSSIKEKQQLSEVLSWMLPLCPEQCMKIISSASCLDSSTVKNLLKGDVKHWRMYLESLPLTDEIAKDLCEIYIKELIAGDANCRYRFRRLLLKLSQSERTAIYNRLPATYGVERLLCDSSQSAADVLDKVITIYHDYDAAELICSHFSPTQPDICLNLLKYMEIDKSDSNSIADAEARIRSLLKCMGDAVDSRKVIDVLPPSTGIEQVSDFLKRSVARMQKEQQLAQYKMALLDRSVKLEKANFPNKKIVIEDKTVCLVCKEAISSSDTLSYLRTGYIIHSRCMKHENLCPLTNAILTLPD
ncbi:hypothetical protein OESDEN_03902 [Oesophagostomum dentatum]|uniref:CNH domain-containing protein n=1 Tax=Oesophagostomum dentatum TaxID=61180 RepID=A0A0B1TJA9_OESDE|nr:hypothetical protein OESDEN_03902 [Oesophagostomum dentatum]